MIQSSSSTAPSSISIDWNRGEGKVGLSAETFEKIKNGLDTRDKSWTINDKQYNIRTENGKIVVKRDWERENPLTRCLVQPHSGHFSTALSEELNSRQAYGQEVVPSWRAFANDNGRGVANRGVASLLTAKFNDDLKRICSKINIEKPRDMPGKVLVEEISRQIANQFHYNSTSTGISTCQQDGMLKGDCKTIAQLVQIVANTLKPGADVKVFMTTNPVALPAERMQIAEGADPHVDAESGKWECNFHAWVSVDNYDYDPLYLKPLDQSNWTAGRAIQNPSN
ncbi:hypothetical protein [Chromobacterium vaccinii]|uniref:hypothetical protein n=1 Tax=Chromobacterium vaccinii TaxID=1108595 RepID=UPI0011AB4DA2|nr:hypothetical protein [Chromobacterium vaccinii]